MKGYNDFNSVEELLEYYKISIPTNKIISEDKKEKEELEIGKKEIKKDKVIYSDDIKKYDNIFKNIIIFTNDRDPESNKTLKNIYEAIDNLKKDNCKIIPTLHVFVAAKIEADEENDGIKIIDNKNEYFLKEESNIDTLIFSRLGVQGEDQCEHIVQLLQDRGFLVLNPVKYSALACDKYDSAILFKKGDIPQPNFTLMTKEILYNEESYKNAMNDVFKDWSDDPDKNKDFDCVVKILDGHGGTGVAVIDGKRLYAWLQLVFAVNPEQRLLIQKKEEADGGDIRVHVLTLRDKQIILGAMKRVKIGGDFRSNVSLGAQAEPVELTKEQENIALKTAKLSKLPWCAVDIMPLVKGSNKELGDNVVLEINASPGTAGISEVLKENFINILLNNLTDPTEFMLQDKIAGFIETVNIDFGNNIKKNFLAKLDTGNSTSASTLEVGSFEDDGKHIKFNIAGELLTFEKTRTMIAIAGEKTYKRPVIIIPEITLGMRKAVNVPLAIVNHRDKKTTNILLSRDLLSKLGYVVHPNNSHVLTPAIEKVKII